MEGMYQKDRTLMNSTATNCTVEYKLACIFRNSELLNTSEEGNLICTAYILKGANSSILHFIVLERTKIKALVEYTEKDSE